MRSLFDKSAESAVSLVKIRLGNHFVGGMHGNDGHADIDRIDIHFRNKLRDRSSAADVHLSEFSRLPDDSVFVEDFSDFPDEFRGSVVGTALSARTGKFGKPRAAGKEGAVQRLANVLEIGVIARIDVGGKAF